tara:strand:+ start:249 stop:602 length:354 start_codon:yes stop_codon:yes gene_type:complete
MDLFGEEVGLTVAEAEAAQRAQVAGSLVGGWIKMQPVRPHPRDINKQGAAAKRIAERDLSHVKAATIGIGLLFPYSTGAPWDLFDLERLFTKAVLAGAKKATEVSAPSGIAALKAAR